MTWNQLLILLLDMQKAKHTSMDKVVQFNGVDLMMKVDIVESLTTGEVYLQQAIEEEDDAGEA